ncbi:hypothetical protein [Paenibacillus humicola]|uniref:hypothetical protein n=1 Tax=Paenibacillus humicola TaxID=3110540 RepID=UPI00237C40A3|nr:hypothetical protein [Paenibacillus humicola]
MAKSVKPRRGASSKGKAISLREVKKLYVRTRNDTSTAGAGTKPSRGSETAGAETGTGSGTGSRPLLRALTIVWVQNNGVPFNTSDGFFAQLSRNGQVVARARFDNFGVAVFRNIGTLTDVSYRLTIFSNNGQIFRQRTLPAGIEAFAVIG